MKIVLFGGAGQLGREIADRCDNLNFTVVSPVRSELNIIEKDSVARFVEMTAPDVIINCAAYTAVDKAEREKELCFQVNRDGAAHVALAAKPVNAHLIHLSTDYVFDGTSSEPIHEEQTPQPLGVYGQSKYEGEQAIFEKYPQASTILRVSSLHGQYGNNFVHTMIKLFESRDLVQVVGDQIMSPTWCGWLASVVLDVCRNPEAGVFHIACSGAISWFEFASQIYQQAKPSEGQWKAELRSIAAAEYTTAASRPAYSVLSTKKISEHLGREPLSWKDGLTNHLTDIGRL